LAKEPDERWQTALDLKRELQWIGEASPSPTPLTHHPRPILPWAVAAAALLVALVVSFMHFREKPPEDRVLRYQLAPPEKALVTSLALSPDGRSLAFAAVQEARARLWVRTLDSLEPQALAGTDGAQFPFWSPDSRYIGFFAQGKLKKIAANGGPAQTLCDAPEGRGGSWNREGVIVIADAGRPLQRVAAAGGEPVPVSSVDPSVGGVHRFPQFLPDGRHFVYLVSVTQAEKAGIFVGSLDSKDSRRVLADASNAVYAPLPRSGPGALLFVRSGTLMAQPFEADRLAPAGEVFPVAEQVGAGTVANYGVFSTSETGGLAYGTGGGIRARQLTWHDRQGKTLGVVGEPGSIFGVSLSPDDKQAAVAISSSGGLGTEDLWLQELARGTLTRFTFDGARNNFAAWSPDGSRIAFGSLRGGHQQLFVKPASGAGQEETLLESEADKRPTDWSRDGRFLLYMSLVPKTKQDLWVLPEDRKPRPLLQSTFNEREGRFSPDGKWVAYSSDESGRYEIYVRGFSGAASGPGGKWQVSTAGGQQARWRGDGKELFYLAPDRKLMAVSIDTTGGSFHAASPQALFETRLPFAGVLSAFLYDAAADGRRFLMADQVGEATPSPMTVVINWPAQARR
jgi:Tol biopolymer transport system component